MEVIKAFKKKYPWIELRSFSGIQIENMELDAGPLMAIAGGVSPDVIYVNFRQSDTYIQNDFLFPLDEFLAQQSEQEIARRLTIPSEGIYGLHRVPRWLRTGSRTCGQPEVMRFCRILKQKNGMHIPVQG